MDAAAGIRSRNLGGPVNRELWRILAGASSLGFYDNHINELRRSFGLAPIRGNALKAFMTAARTVMLVSRHYYGDGAADWAPVTWGGFSHWAGPAGQRSIRRSPTTSTPVTRPCS